MVIDHVQMLQLIACLHLFELSKRSVRGTRPIVCVYAWIHTEDGKGMVMNFNEMMDVTVALSFEIKKI